MFPSCRRTAGNLHANKEQRGVTGYKTVAIRIYLPPSPPPLPNTLSKSLRKRSRCRRKRRLILIFESSSSFTFRLKLRNRFSPSIHLRPSNWTSFHLRPSLESGLYTALFATVPLNFFHFSYDVTYHRFTSVYNFSYLAIRFPIPLCSQRIVSRSFHFCVSHFYGFILNIISHTFTLLLIKR